MSRLGADFFDRSVHQVARELIGCRLLFDGIGGTIVETESYEADDPACHAYVGLTERTRVLGMDPTMAVLVGAILLIVVILAIVAMSRRQAPAPGEPTRRAL